MGFESIKTEFEKGIGSDFDIGTDELKKGSAELLKSAGEGIKVTAIELCRSLKQSLKYMVGSFKD